MTPHPKRPVVKGRAKALPPIYVRVSATGELSNEEVRDKDYCRAHGGIPGQGLPTKCWPVEPGDRIVKYLPAPTRARARAGGGGT